MLNVDYHWQRHEVLKYAVVRIYNRIRTCPLESKQIKRNIVMFVHRKILLLQIYIIILWNSHLHHTTPKLNNAIWHKLKQTSVIFVHILHKK